jgi:hypothetical protein
MSSTGFRWFVCAVVAVLVAIMLVAVRANAAWPAFMPDIAAGTNHGASSGDETAGLPVSAAPDGAAGAAVG